eukprot:7786214-Pyramimonas_sp.AAC.2
MATIAASSRPVARVSWRACAARLHARALHFGSPGALRRQPSRSSAIALCARVDAHGRVRACAACHGWRRMGRRRRRRWIGMERGKGIMRANNGTLRKFRRNEGNGGG